MSVRGPQSGAKEIRGDPQERIELVIANRLEELARVSESVDRLVARHRLPEDAGADLNIALDEVLANLLQHAYDDAEVHEIRIALSAYPRAVVVEVEDDGRPFDPLVVPPPDRAALSTGSRIGGRGILFVRSLMSEVRYQRADGKNRLTLTRIFEASN